LFLGLPNKKTILNAHFAGELEQQLAAVEEQNNNILANKNSFDDLNIAWNALESAGITENKYTRQTIASLSNLWNNIQALAKKKIEILNNHILEKNANKVTGDQEKAFKQSFDHFDKDKTGSLDRIELKACLQSLDHAVSDSALDNIFTKYANENGRIPFSGFIQFITNISADRDSPEDIKNAFATLAGGADYVTKEKLSPVFSQDQVNYFLARMPPYPGVDGAYDYKKFTDDVLYGST